MLHMSKDVSEKFKKELSQELGDLYGHYFDHGYFLDNELKQFVREFEVNNSYKLSQNNLNQSMQRTVDSLALVDGCLSLLAKMESIPPRITACTSTLQGVLDRIEQRTETRMKERKEGLVRRELEMKIFLEQIQRETEAIDREYEAKVQLLLDQASNK